MDKRSVLLVLLCSAGLSGALSAQTAAAPRLVRIAGGTYLQGSAEAPYSANERVHATTVGDFLLADTETTQALYKAVTGKSPSKFPGADKPVDSVSWLDAVGFCNALSEREGLAKAYAIEGAKVAWDRAADGYRLPTEAEWEYAARGGQAGALGDVPLAKAGFAGSAVADEVAWYDRNSAKASQAVGRKAANQLGLFDMSGNVWEWCWDWYGEYPAAAVVDPEGGPAAPGQKVLRGGAWFTPVNLLRVTYRYWNLPTFKANSVGFRLARNAPPLPPAAAAEPVAAAAWPADAAPPAAEAPAAAAPPAADAVSGASEAAAE
jgi:formylglycine-generating enzyme required for sulfatase activity